MLQDQKNEITHVQEQQSSETSQVLLLLMGAQPKRPARAKRFSPRHQEVLQQSVEGDHPTAVAVKRAQDL